MDWSHFGMTRLPFRPGVDTGAYFPASSHEAARAGLVAAFARRDPVVLLDGGYGTGKSLVAWRWLEQLSSAITRIMLPNIHATRPADLLQAILFDLNQPYQGMTEQELRLAVMAQLMAAAETEHPVVLLIDEAQHLSHAAIEEVRLLGNIEARGGSSLFVVLVALPTLRAALARPAYEAFAQRVATRCLIEPFSEEESVRYIRHQIVTAGGDARRAFEEDAIALLAGACGGVPRMLNRAAALSAEVAAGAGSTSVDVEAVLESLARLNLTPPEIGEPSQPVIPVRPTEPTRGAGGRGRGAKNAAEPSPVPGTKQKAAKKRSA